MIQEQIMKNIYMEALKGEYAELRSKVPNMEAILAFREIKKYCLKTASHLAKLPGKWEIQ